MSGPFELRFDETPSAALSRIVSQQALATAGNLRDDAVALERRVHETRKRFKELRAVLRLFRDALGEEQFAIENHWYRDAARELAEYRDADAIVAAIDALPPKVKKKIGRLNVQKLRRAGQHEQRAVYADSTAAAGRLENIATQLPVAAGRLTSISIGDDFTAVQSRLIATLRIGKRAMKRAFETGDSVAFHEWRKRVKDHWYHVQLLVPVGQRKLVGREQRLGKLSHVLGSHHDLDVIRRMMATAEATFTANDARRIDRILAARQRQLEKRARKIAAPLYKKSSEEMLRKAAKRWKKASRSAPELHLVASA